MNRDMNACRAELYGRKDIHVIRNPPILFLYEVLNDKTGHDDVLSHVVPAEGTRESRCKKVPKTQQLFLRRITRIYEKFVYVDRDGFKIRKLHSIVETIDLAAIKRPILELNEVTDGIDPEAVYRWLREYRKEDVPEPERPLTRGQLRAGDKRR